MSHYLQPILGTTRRNPVFTVSKHSHTGDYHVYYGLELFEVVPDERNDIRFKLMLAHLHNVGAPLTQLQEVFEVDRRTILKWSRALKSGSAEKLTRALAGREVNRKLTRPLREYVRIRFAYVYADDKRSYSRTLRREMKEIFGAELSAETLRPLLTQLRAEWKAKEAGRDPDPGPDPDPDPGPDSDSDPDSAGQDDCTTQTEAVDPEEAPAEDAPQACAGEPRKPPQALEKGAEPLEALDESTASSEPKLSPHRREYVQSQTRWCAHLGLPLLSEPFQSLRQALPQEGEVLCQLLAQVVLGAANLEQAKRLSGQDIALLLGFERPPLGTPAHQRTKLAGLAEKPDLPRHILRWNFQRLQAAETAGTLAAQPGAPPQTAASPPAMTFYFDPHVKHYTGQQNVLKGWCAKIRWADKIMNMDFAHDEKGNPVYLENTDNYDDMRKRFEGFQRRFRTTLGIDPRTRLTWVIDRGIYALEVFERIAQDPHCHLVTWEKDYRGDGWEEGRPAAGTLSLQRPRNRADDLRTYRFAWVEQPWKRHPSWRQIIVRATNPDGREVEVSILCDDPHRAVQQIIIWMFSRWMQENDFKYMDEHFGLNEITSYQSQSYARLGEQLEDRRVKNSAYHALEKARHELRNKVSKLLLQQRDADKKEQQRAAKIAELEATLPKAPGKEAAARRTRLGRLKGASRTAQKHRLARQNKIDELEKAMAGLEAQLEQTSREVSRIETLIGRDCVRLNTAKKQLMDVIKITARNLFYEALQPFKKTYDNYRDDHVWFRHLLRAGGVIEKVGPSQLRCHFVGIEEVPRKVLAVFKKLLDQFNQNSPLLPGPGGTKITFQIAPKSAIKLAISNPQTSPQN